MRMPRSLRGRLGLSLGVVLTLLWVAAASLTAMTLRHEMDEVFDSALAATAQRLLPLVVVAGVMGVAGIDIKPATAVIFSIAFGIAVDDTIHVLARLRQEIAAGRALRPALHETLLGTGRAVVLTSVVLLGGFGVLVTSEFQSVIYLGGLVSLTVALALFADLFLLPALLHVLRPALGQEAPPVAADGTAPSHPA